MDLKKTALALLALGLTGVASAGGFMPAPACTNHPVTVPCERTAWDLGFTAYWVRPTSDFAGVVGNFDESLSFANVSSQDYDLDHKFGYGVEASYHWGTGSDFNANWTHFRESEDTLYPGFSSGYSLTDVDVRFDQVNLELGQHIDVGPSWDLRAHMGVAYAKINVDAETLTDSTEQDVLNGGSSADYKRLESEVDGFGPRAGFDLAYHISDNFSVVGHSAVSVLAGERESTVTTATINSFVLSSIDVYPAERHGVMLGAEGKIGLAYNASMSQGSASIEGGYSVATYHNGIDALGLFTSPFSLDGFYLKAKYVS